MAFSGSVFVSVSLAFSVVVLVSVSYISIPTYIRMYVYCISPTTVWASFLRYFFGLSLALSSLAGFLCGQYNDSGRLAGSV